MRGKIVFFLGIFLVGLSVYSSEYRDGEYRGEHSFISVSLKIEDNKITAIDILRHGGGGKKYEEMIEPLIGRILEQQTTDVDAVSGATVSSAHLKKAVAQALQKACED